MEINDLMAIAGTVMGAVGGAEGIVMLVKWWFSRKAAKRQDEASAEAAENKNNRDQVDWLEKRVEARDSKIDSLYMELRNEQNKHVETIHLLHETELKLQEAEYKKCLKHGCAGRIPPSDY